MIQLNGNTHKLQCVMSGAAATTNPDFWASWMQLNTSSLDTGGAAGGTLNGTTDVDLVTGVASRQLIVKSLHVYNRDTAAVTLTFKMDVSGTERFLYKCTLQTGESVSYGEAGWVVTDANGRTSVAIGLTDGDYGDVSVSGGGTAIAVEGVSGAFTRTGTISPAQITADQNDYAPTGFATCNTIRLDANAARKITGLAGGAAGREVTIYNVGSYDLLFANENASSSAANRFAVRRPIILPPNTSLSLWYDTTSSRWRLSAERPRTCTNILAADVVNANAVANTIADVTGLSFDVLAGHRYKFRFQIVYDSAANATGSRWSINGPTLTSLDYRSSWITDATTFASRALAADTYDLPNASNATSLLAGNIAEVYGVIVPSADGTVIARFASEVAASAITAKGDVSFVEYECLG